MENDLTTLEQDRALLREELAAAKRQLSEYGELKKYQDYLEIRIEAQTLEFKKKNKRLEQEISERKQIEAALLESQDNYRAVMENIEEGFYEVDLNGNMTLFNDALAEIHGYSRTELMGMNFRQFTDAETAQRVYKIFNSVYRTGRPSKGSEYEIIHKTGKRIVLETSIVLKKNVSGVPIGFNGIIRDITERKQAEETLKKTHDRIAWLLNSISSILIALSEDNRIVFWNTTAEKEFGLSGKEAEGKLLTDTGIQWDGDQMVAAVSRCRRENAPVGLDNLKFLQQNGKDGWLGIRLTPILGEESSGRMILIQGANITQRRIMESQLTQAQKLESIGQLAAGIAHEINTPTQYVGDNVRFLQTSFEDLIKVLRHYDLFKEAFKEGKMCDHLIEKVEEVIGEADLDYLSEEIPKAFQQTLDGLDRVSRIVHSMKAFAHPGKEEKVYMDLNKAIETTLVVARNEWKYVAEVVTELDPSLPMVPCIPGDINQVLLNILVNAAQAVAEVVGNGAGGKGTITIVTRREDPWAEIRISDTGKGVPEGIRSKIFDPFFTTKEVGKGTGQGLAISHTAIVEKHQGSLSFTTEINQGTTFNIRLPLEEGRDGGTSTI
jgi:PAS domain S-box-containing protein